MRQNNIEGKESLSIKSQQHPIVVFLAKFISVIFHPLFIPLYVAGYMLFLHQLLFAGRDTVEKIPVMASVFVNLCLLPALSVFLLWRLKFTSSIYLNTQKERIIPLAAIMLFSFWCWYVYKNLNAPQPFINFLLGVFFTVIAAWLANIYFKISLHSLAAGGLLFAVINTEFITQSGNSLFMAVAILIAGLVMTSRLIASDHKQPEVYIGFFGGIICQWLATVI